MVIRIVLQIILVLLTITVRSQVWPNNFTCENSFRYAGPPAQINHYSIDCLPNDLYRIDFCTENVPDQLIIYLNKEKTDSIFLCTGKNLTSVELLQKGYYKGYTELIYENSLVIIKTKSIDLPQDY